MSKSLETIEGLLRGLNFTGSFHDDEPNEDLTHDIQELLSCCRASGHRVNSFAENAETLMKRVEGSVFVHNKSRSLLRRVLFNFHYSNHEYKPLNFLGVANQVHSDSITGKSMIDRHFSEQRIHLDTILDKLGPQLCPTARGKERNVSYPNSPAVIPGVVDYDGSGDTTDDAGSGDDEDAPEGSAEGEVTIVPFAEESEYRGRSKGKNDAVSTTPATSGDELAPKTWGSLAFPVPTTLLPILTSTDVTGQAIQVLERSCEALARAGGRTSGLYRLGSNRDWNPGGRDFYTRNCELEIAGGGWTVIQQRGGSWGGVENFTRSWDEYSIGFGDLAGEFWFGNEYIHR